MLRLPLLPLLLGAVALLPLKADAVEVVAGTILVADPGRNGVIAIDPLTGEQQVLSSGGLFVEPTGITVDPQSGDILVADSGGPSGQGGVIAVSPLDGGQRPVSLDGVFAEPSGVTIDANGKAQVADAFSGLITVDLATGAQTLLASVLVSDVAVGPLGSRPLGGNLFAIEPSTRTLYRFNRFGASSGTIEPVSQGGDFLAPFSIAAQRCRFFANPGGNGAIYVADAGNTGGALDGKVVVVRTDAFDSGNPSGNQEILSQGGELVDPTGIAFTEATCGDLVVVDGGAANGAGAVLRIDVETGAQFVVSTGQELVEPRAIAVFPLVNSPTAAPETFAIDRESRAVLRVDPATGTATTLSADGLLEQPEALLVAPDGGPVYVADRGVAPAGPGAVVAIDRDTGAQRIVTSGGNLLDPVDLVLDATGNLLVLDQGQNGIVRVEPDTGAQTLVPLALVGLSGIAVNRGTGEVWVVSANDATLYRVDLATGTAEPRSGGGLLRMPQAVVATPEGKLVIADVDPGAAGILVEVDPALFDTGNPGSNQTLFASGAPLSEPSGLVREVTGDFLVSDRVAGLLRVSGASGNPVVVGAEDPLDAPDDVSVAPVTLQPGSLIVASGPSILQVDPTTGLQSVLSSRGLLSFLTDVTVEPGGTTALALAGGTSVSLVRVDLTTGTQSLITRANFMQCPAQVAVAGAETALVADVCSQTVIAVDLTSGTQRIVGAFTPQDPRGVVIDSSTPEQDAIVGLANVRVIIGPGGTENLVNATLLRIRFEPDPPLVLDTVLDDSPPLELFGQLAEDPASNAFLVANGRGVLSVDPATGASETLTQGGLIESGLSDLVATVETLFLADLADRIVAVDRATGGQRLVSFGALLDFPRGISILPVPEPGPATGAVAAVSTLGALASGRRRRRARAQCSAR